MDSHSHDAFVARLGGVHRTVCGNGQRILDMIMRTSTEMLLDRGMVSVSRDRDEHGFRVHGWDANGNEHIRLILCTEDRLGVRLTRTLLEEADNLDVLILVSIEGPTPFARKECNLHRVQFFTAAKMCVNVTRHALVPRHTQISSPPLGIEVDCLPKLLEHDAVAQYYNWKCGTIVRIERLFGGHEPVVYYRVVV